MRTLLLGGGGAGGKGGGARTETPHVVSCWQTPLSCLEREGWGDGVGDEGVRLVMEAVF